MILKILLIVSFNSHLSLFMSFIHEDVCPHILSLFVLIHLYKNLSENELIRFWPLYEFITIFWLV